MVKKGLTMFLFVISVMLLSACGSSTSSKPEEKKPTNAEEVVQALKSAGLPIGEIKVFDASSDPNELLGRPGQYTSKVNFIDTRVKSEGKTNIDVISGGSVEFFDNKDDAQARFEYVSTISKKMGGMFVEYDYLEGKVFLRLSKELTPEQAKEYENVLKEIFK